MALGILSVSRLTIGISWWSTPILLGFILFLTVLSYEYLEKPVRKRAVKHRWEPFLIGLSALVLTAVFGKTLATPSISDKLRIFRDDDGIFQGEEESVRLHWTYHRRKNKNCGSPAADLSQSVIHSSLRRCLWEGQNKTPAIAILGDSHAHQLFPIAESIARDKNLSVYNFEYGGCLVPQDPRKVEDKCGNVNKVPMWVYKELQRPVIFVIASIADPILHIFLQ